MNLAGNMLKLLPRCTNYVKPSMPTLLCNKLDLLSQQTRTTFVLRRRFPPRLHKKHESRAILKSRQFIYELVDHKNSKKSPQIKVILKETVKDFGPAGAIISVPPISGYEKLLLPQLAIYATPENIKKYATQDLSVPGATKVTPLQRTERFLSSLYLVIPMSLDHKWTIEKKHIRLAFRMAGVSLQENVLQLPEESIEGPNKDLQNKQFYVTVRISETLSIKVRCIIHHFTSDESRQLPRWDPSMTTNLEAVFSKDQEILDEMPKHKRILKNEKIQQKEN